jgi:hypothetical protein
VLAIIKEIDSQKAKISLSNQTLQNSTNTAPPLPLVPPAAVNISHPIEPVLDNTTNISEGPNPGISTNNTNTS